MLTRSNTYFTIFLPCQHHQVQLLVCHHLIHQPTIKPQQPVIARAQMNNTVTIHSSPTKPHQGLFMQRLRNPTPKVFRLNPLFQDYSHYFRGSCNISSTAITTNELSRGATCKSCFTRLPGRVKREKAILTSLNQLIHVVA